MFAPNHQEGRHFDPTVRGLHVAYQENEVNYCPGCGRSHWIIGRISAECAFCTTALPLPASLKGQPFIQVRHNSRNLCS